MIEPTKQPARESVDDLAEDFVAELRRGASPSIEAWAAAHPEHAATIRELFPTILALERLRAKREAGMRPAVSFPADRIQRLGDFRLIRELGRGGMGVVYEAEQESLGRRVALKILPQSVLLDARQVERFRHEARTAAALHHTHIVPIFGVGEDEGFHYYVMQRIEGTSLRQWRAQASADAPGTARVDYMQVARIGIQVASALHYAHERGVLHRDIKPANLLMDAEGMVWVTDFGVARALHIDSSEGGRDVAGTLRYMAREQFEGHGEPRSDVFSLAVTLYELLVGRPAYDDAERRSMLLDPAADRPPRPLRDIDPSLPADLEAIVLKGASPNPDERYATAADLADDLRRFTEDRPVLARPLHPVARCARWARRNRAVAGLATATAALLLIVALVATAGYWQVRAALRRESEEHATAANTARLAASALDKIFDRFAGGGLDVDEQGVALERLTSSPAVSKEAAALLQELVAYYDELAARHDHDPAWARKVAEARRYVGNIRYQLGQYEEAIVAFREALEHFERLAPLHTADPAGNTHDLRELCIAHCVTLASIHNALGSAQSYLGHHDMAHEEQERALALIADAIQQWGSSPALEFAEARTRYLMGRRLRPGMGPLSMPPRGMGRGGPGFLPGPGPRVERLPERPPPWLDASVSEPPHERAQEDAPRHGTDPVPQGTLDRDPRWPPRRGPGRPPDFGEGGPPIGEFPGPPWLNRQQALEREQRRNHLRRAADLLRHLLADAPANVSYRLLLACCLREQVSDVLALRSDEENGVERTAIALLESLVRESPDVTVFRFELLLAYSEISVFGETIDPRQWEEAATRLRKARELAEALATEHSQVPAYTSQLIHVNFKLATLLQRAAHAHGESAQTLLTEAEQAYRQAIRYQTLLLRENPDSEAYQAWLALFEQRLAALERGELQPPRPPPRPSMPETRL